MCKLFDPLFGPLFPVDSCRRHSLEVDGGGDSELPFLTRLRLHREQKERLAQLRDTAVVPIRAGEVDDVAAVSSGRESARPLLAASPSSGMMSSPQLPSFGSQHQMQHNKAMSPSTSLLNTVNSNSDEEDAVEVVTSVAGGGLGLSATKPVPSMCCSRVGRRSCCLYVCV